MAEFEMIPCEFKDEFFRSYGDMYVCTVTGVKFEDNKKYQFDVKKCRDANEVEKIQFRNCNMPKIPKNFPWHQFPNLEILEIKSLLLKRISTEDFHGLSKENLREVDLSCNQLQYLPGDLFDGMKKLKRVNFCASSNPIEYIEPELTSSLKKLDYLDFRGHTKINMFYDADNKNSIVTLEEIRKKILDNCRPPDSVKQRMKEKKNRIKQSSKLENHDLSKEDLIKEILKLRNENQHYKDQNGFVNTMEAALKKEEFKDFIVTAGNQEFKVNKFLLIANSTVLADMIEKNPEAEKLKLDRIPFNIFQHILDFLYNDTLPRDGATFRDIFIASGRLKIEKLKDYAGVKLIDQVNAENALEMLNLANKYDHKELKLKAFVEVKKMFPEDN